MTVSGAITNTGDITVKTTGGKITVSGAITNTGNLTLQNDTSTDGQVTISGNINTFGCITNSGSGSGRTEFSGLLGTNVHRLVQNGSSKWYSGANNNSFTGAVIIMKGQVQSANDTFYQSWGTGPVTLAAGSESNDTQLTVSGGANNGTFVSPITVEANNPGRASIVQSCANDPRTFSGLITLNSHDLTIRGQSGNTLTLNGGVTGTGSLDLNPQAVGITMGAVNPIGAITIRGDNANTADLGTIGDNVTGVTNNGPGSILRLDSASTYSGPTVLNAGTSRVDMSSAGTTASITSGPFGKGTLILNGGALMTLTATDRRILNAVTINSNTVFGAAATYTGSLTFSNTVTLGSATPTLTVNLPTSDWVRFDGAVEGSGGIVKDGDGILILDDANTYSGDTTINAGRLTLKTTNSLPTTTVLNINASGTSHLDFVGTNRVAELWLGGEKQAGGATYGGTGSGADVVNTTYFITGSGVLQTQVPDAPRGTVILLR